MRVQFPAFFIGWIYSAVLFPSHFIFSKEFIMNAARFWVPLLVLTFVSPALAVVIDFDDQPSAVYSVGNSFTIEGIQFNVIGYNGAGSSIRLDGSGANKSLSMGNSIGINIDVPSNTGLVEFRFADFCSSCSTTGITVNGQASNPTVQLTALDGTTLGGVEIDVILGPAAFQTMRLIGPITSFATGGTEYFFDDLRIAVPEPCTCTLLLVGVALILIRQ
jgi:hypothetical protein